MVIKNLILAFYCFYFLQAKCLLAATESFRNDLPPIIISTPIDGTAQKVWDVLVDFENYGHWNKWVTKLEGDAEVGAVVKASSESGQSLVLKITSMDEPRRLCWDDVTWFTHFGIGGWRCRSIEDNPDGEGVVFINHFEYTGIFGKVLRSFTLDFLENGMLLENESLRNYIESKNELLD